MGLISAPVHFNDSESAQTMYNAVSSNGYIQMAFGNEVRRMVCSVSENSVIALLEQNEYNISRYLAITGIDIAGLKFMSLGLVFLGTLNTRAYFTSYYQRTSIYMPDITDSPARTFDSNGYRYPYSSYHGRIETQNTYTTTYTGIYNVPLYNNIDTAISDARNAGYGFLLGFPITYRLTNCTAPDAPSEANIGSTVTVPFVFPDGYGIVNNENVYVTNNGVIVPSTYSDGVLTFEMPNPG